MPTQKICIIITNVSLATDWLLPVKHVIRFQPMDRLINPRAKWLLLSNELRHFPSLCYDV